MTGIRTTRKGITFLYVAPFSWAYINRKVVKVPDSERPAGVLICYPDGTKRFISNNWYIDINTDSL